MELQPDCVPSSAGAATQPVSSEHELGFISSENTPVSALMSVFKGPKITLEYSGFGLLHTLFWTFAEAN